jgi:hypothetical protein
MWVDFEKLDLCIARARLARFAYDMLRLYLTQPWEVIE